MAVIPAVAQVAQVVSVTPEILVAGGKAVW